MNSKPLIILFRILLIAVFITGMIYLIAFITLIQSPATQTSEQFLAACRRWVYYYFAYTMLCIAATVLSILTFPATPKAASITRTAFTVRSRTCFRSDTRSHFSATRTPTMQRRSSKI